MKVHQENTGPVKVFKKEMNENNWPMPGKVLGKFKGLRVCFGFIFENSG
jgi:hypothetical protein